MDTGLDWYSMTWIGDTVNPGEIIFLLTPFIHFGYYLAGRVL